MKHTLCIFALLAVCGLQAAFGQFINIRLSYKVILNPANGDRPSDSEDADITNTVAGMNALMANYQRGFRFWPVEIETVGGINDTTGPSRYYNTDFRGASEFFLNEVENAAVNNPTIYKWRNNAINIYINQGTSGGVCSFPNSLLNDHIVLIGDGMPAWLHLHEIGHYFFLYHTHGSICACSDPGLQGLVCHTIPGDDFVSDTLWDLSYWTQDDLARHSFGRIYDQLNPAEQQVVDNTYFNVMSYHGSPPPCGTSAVTERLTERQLDRFTDAASGVRRYVVSGRTRFVDWRNSCPEPAGNSGCDDANFGGPYRRVVDAITAADAGGGDIVMIRPGHYNEPQRISKRVMLRSTRAGPVVIGRP